MKKRPLKFEVYVHSHATEDEDLITSSIISTLGNMTIRVETLQGQYSPIKRISGFAEGEQAEGLASTLLRALLSRSGALNEIMKGVDNNRLYIRLDKQEMVRGLITIGGDNQVKLVITAKNNREIMDLIRKAAEGV